MTIAMPPVRQMVSPNYTASLIKHDLFIFHREEGGYAGSNAWLCDPRARASAHLTMKLDGSEVTQLVPLQFKAWAEVAGNSLGVSLEIEGFDKDGMSDTTLNAAALIAAWNCLAYDIPPVWAQHDGQRGLRQHNDGGAAWGGHTDCSPVGSPLWLNIVATTQNVVTTVKALPRLPDFALHGAPGPHEIVVPPDVMPTPTHGGADRSDGDTHDHATPSKFPIHSIAALQSDLNALGADLTVDGWFGAATRAKLMQFQQQKGLAVDGMIGPASWRALETALAA